MPKKKVNPRRKPATQEDVRKAADKAQNDALRLVLYLMLYVLADKHNATPEELKVFQDELNFMLDSINRGDVQWTDIRDVLDEEYDVHLDLH